MFAQVKRRTAVVQCYRVNELSSFEIYPRKKKTKKTQKDVIRKTKSISSPVYNMTSVYAGPIEPIIDTTLPNEEYRTRRWDKRKNKVIFNFCDCNDNRIDKNYNDKYHAKTWDSITRFYGDADTTEIWADPRKKVYSMPRDKNNYSKKHKRKSKIHKKRGKYLKNNNVLNDVDDHKKHSISEKPVSFDTRLISLYKKENIKNQNALNETPVTEDRRNANRRFSRNSLSLNNVVKIKDKIVCLCNKYSHKTQNVKPQNNVDKNASRYQANNYQEFNNYNFVSKSDKNESEQTGEPFFEVQVNPRDMCLLNPAETKENIKKYGKIEKNELKCICPSRGRLKPGEVCKAGICKKAYKNKQINFNCWCEKIIAECGDGSCDVRDARSTRIKRRNSQSKTVQRLPKKLNKPLLELQLDMDKLCVVNPKEMEDKILNNITVNEMCSTGVCRDAALKQKTTYFCKCISKKLNPLINECAEGTCMDPTQKKKSKFSLFCTRICSKSENWSRQNRNIDKKRIQRRSVYEINTNKLWRGKNYTQSNYIQKKDKPEIRQENVPNELIYRHPIKLLSRTAIGRFFNSSNEISNQFSQKTKDASCSCECAGSKMDDNKIKLKNKKRKKQQLRKINAQRRQTRKASYHNPDKEIKRRAKLDKKLEKKAAKERMKKIKMMQKKLNEEPLDINFCTAFLVGILKIGFRSVVLILTVILSIIKSPKKSYWYVRDRLRDPAGTCLKLRKWFQDAFLIKKLQAEETVRGSDTLAILADHFLDSTVYQTMAPKGKTKKQQMLHEQKRKARKRRIRKREQEAIHSCRHMLLTTLRKTPCLWIYHICPNFYPQFLSLLAVMRSFLRILLFLVAFACWTPCILSFEICRAVLCCFMCTG